MQIKININGREIVVREGTTIMEAANLADIYVPHFCYHKKLSIAANCRMCMVDVEKAPKALPACATPVVDGMVVHTDSERAQRAQNSVMEFLLINHPLDCPICDQGGECQLQDLAVGYGISRSRYQEEKRVVFEKNLGPLIATDMTRCIHCTRCVRFGREVAGIMELGMIGRGEHAEIMPFIEKTVDSEISGNMIDICPVGALTSKPFRYTARTWELTRRPAVASHDSWGSHLSLHIKDKKVMRINPLERPDIHECWISDRDRFSYQGLHAPDRAHEPMMREENGVKLQPKPWQYLLTSLTEKLIAMRKQHGADKIGFFISPRASCEEAYLLQGIARHLGCNNVDSRLLQRDFSDNDDDIVGLGVEAEKLNQLNTVFFVGAEPGRELPLLAAHCRQRRGKKTYLSLSAMDIGAQVPLKHQILTRPENLHRMLTRLVELAETGEDREAGRDLFTDSSAETQKNKAIVACLQKARSGGIIWLGDVARTAPRYGKIIAAAKRLATCTGCRIGVLSDAANGIGVRRHGGLPTSDGLNTAAMLRAGLRGVVLFRCEPEDFCERAMAKEMLDGADFVAAINSHTGGVTDYANMVLPTAEFSETEGTYINGFGVSEWTEAATPPPGKARPGWKILRLLGEYLSVPGFNFNDIADVRGVAPPPSTDEKREAVADNADAPVKETGDTGIGDDDDNSGYSLYGGAPTYGGDVLVRRSPALAATKQGSMAAMVQMNPDDMHAAGLAENDAVVVGDWQTTVAADARLAAGVVRCWPPLSSQAVNVSVQAAARKQTA